MQQHYDDSRKAASDPSRKPYRRPEIIEWGSVVDLTRSFTSGTGDPSLTTTGTAGNFRTPPRLPPG